MQAELTKYATAYKVKHQGHKLEWDHALGTVELKARFKAGTKDLSVSLYQAVVLLLFNETAKLLFTEILEQTRMGASPPFYSLREPHWSKSTDTTELRRTLQSLACGKKKVLKKYPPGKDVEDTDVFLYNPDFSDPRAKVHINSIQVKETVKILAFLSHTLTLLTWVRGSLRKPNGLIHRSRAIAGII
jgi:cullin-4